MPHPGEDLSAAVDRALHEVSLFYRSDPAKPFHVDTVNALMARAQELFPEAPVFKTMQASAKKVSDMVTPIKPADHISAIDLITLFTSLLGHVQLHTIRDSR